MQGQVIGAACSLAGQHVGCRYGPDYLQDMLLASSRLKGNVNWCGTVRESALLSHKSESSHKSKYEEVSRYCRRLRDTVAEVASRPGLPIIVGGDHSCAIGTWSGVAKRCQGPIGLLWVDAHLDSHTPNTSPSGAIHGMPLAVLLGHGDSKLLKLLPRKPLISPQHTVVVGVRSYEQGERDLLSALNVTVITIGELKKNPYQVLMKAYRKVASSPYGFGISVDMDAIDPKDAPAVSVPEPGGIAGKDLVHWFQSAAELTMTKRLKALEITEYNPKFDSGHKTSRLLMDLMHAFLAKQ